MFLPRSITFVAALVALVALHLAYERWSGIWMRPKTPEAAQVLGYYVGIVFAVFVGAIVVASLAFPAAIAADRFFQRKRRARAMPYLFFSGLSLLVTGVLFASLDGEIHALDFPMALLYFLAGTCIVWKLAYEMPKRKNE